MVRVEIVRRKLAHLAGYLDELRAYKHVDIGSYLAHGGPRRAVERLIQLVIETAVDINVHIVTEIEEAPPPDYRTSFLAAARCGLIDDDLAERLAPSAGLRNALPTTTPRSTTARSTKPSRSFSRLSTNTPRAHRAG